METKDYCFTCPYTDCRYASTSQCDYWKNKGKVKPKKEKLKLSKKEKKLKKKLWRQKYYLANKEKFRKYFAEKYKERRRANEA